MSKAWVLMFDKKFPQSLLWNGGTTRAEPWGFRLTQSVEWTRTQLNVHRLPGNLSYIIHMQQLLIRLINKVRDHFGLLLLFAGLVRQRKCSYWWVKPISFEFILWEDTELCWIVGAVPPWLLEEPDEASGSGQKEMGPSLQEFLKHSMHFTLFVLGCVYITEDISVQNT